MVEHFNIDLLEELDRAATIKNVARFFKGTQKRGDSPFMRLINKANINYSSPQWSDMPKGGGNAGATDKLDARLIARDIVRAVYETIDNMTEKDFSRSIMKELYLSGGNNNSAMIAIDRSESQYYALRDIAYVRFAEAMDSKIVLNGKPFCVYIPTPDEQE